MAQPEWLFRYCIMERNNVSMKLLAFSELIVINNHYDKVTLNCIERDVQLENVLEISPACSPMQRWGLRRM